ncbi:TetR family transcriptional regulator [Nocardioides sp. zg-579]|uniref:TetR family transcriptional regulator n=1 Tax=Nocardioides marmotae TaxID=2663857 RepID=A0A6I3J4Y6_9ACTN|nr:TetR/AcrR family transcriptional regulator [Nocardioides marmotae]MCR6030586.1 TetR family transcriptional regulator [Gordonia jinghuaiqii]MTB94222.1 TetR family transcriptional regulator [Nocardioides marmotae]QKE00505.1 TetR/AcrR family transcriptional regulator [Nocardioides marmotae]
MTAPGSADWRRYDPPDLPRVLDAALQCFAEQGYHGTSIRDLAATAGLSVPGVYHHYRSKQEILLALMMAVMDELLARSEAALASAPDEPSARFDVLVESLLRFHMFRRQQAFVASSEIRSLAPENREAYVGRRDTQQRMIDDVVTAGVEAGVFGTPYPLDAARAVSTLCVGVASWYREDGPLAPDELVARHLVLARGLVQA